jgi:flagellar hook-length control protein FliK
MASDTIATPAVHGDAAQTIYPATNPPGASPVTAETLPKAAQGADAPSIAGRQVMASIAADLAAASPVTATPASPAHAGAFDGFASLTAFGRTRDGTTAAVDAAPDSGFAPLLVRGAEALQGAARAAPVVAPTPLPLVLVLDADFDDGLGARVTWMAEQRIDHAQIRVSPEALGPIDVRLQMDGHRVNAQFHAASPDVRQALESGMDRLRDMLGRQGMELGQAQVGSGARQGADSHAGGRWQGHGGSAGADGPAPVQPSMRVALRPSRGLLDEYA